MTNKLPEIRGAGLTSAAPPGAAPLLEIRGLSKTFGGTRALVDVDLDVRADEIHALVGTNGAGKSTLIKTLAGYHHPDPGASARFAGKPTITVSRPERRNACEVGVEVITGVGDRAFSVGGDLEMARETLTTVPAIRTSGSTTGSARSEWLGLPLRTLRSYLPVK